MKSSDCVVWFELSTSAEYLFLLFFSLSQSLEASRIICSHSSVQTSGPLMEMWSRLSNILFKRRDFSLVLIRFMELAPRSGHTFDIGNVRMTSAIELRSGKRASICSSFFNTTTACVSPIKQALECRTLPYEI